MKKVLAITTILLLSLFAVVSIAGENLSWLTFDKGLAEAKKSDKKILVDVYTDWCGWCKRMDRDTYLNKEVAGYLAQQFVLVKLNAESDQRLHYKGKSYSEAEIAHSFHVTGYPTTLFFEPNGDHITSLSGYVKADEFLNITKFIGENYYKTKKFEEYMHMQESGGKKQ